jgi:hypothetical protein
MKHGSNFREPDTKVASAILRACALNGWIDPGDRQRAAPPPAEVGSAMCGRCGRPFQYRRHEGSGARPLYCLACARYPKPKA